MKCRIPAVLGLVFLSFGVLPCRAQHGGGGHGGGGGHSSMGGHSIGQSIGHSIGHVFGHSGSGHGGASYSGPGASGVPGFFGATGTQGRVARFPGLGPRGIHPGRSHRPLTTLGFRRRRSFLGFADLGYCSPFEGFYSGYYGGYSNCLQDDFFLDPLLGDDPGQGSDVEPSELTGDADEVESDSDLPADYQPDVIVEQDPPAPVDAVPHHRSSAHEPDTILQLKSGSMYGLRDYWVVDGQLHYVTNYGGQNSIPLAQIDFEKTSQLNAERGGKFAVQP